MPAMQVSVPHEHGKEVATERLQRFSEMIKEHYGHKVHDVEDNWVEHALHFAFSTKGLKIKGNIKVEEHQVTLDGSLPFAAAVFRGRIEKEVRTALTRALA